MSQQISIESLFKPGDQILIDKIEIGWILEKYVHSDNVKFKIQYELTKFIEEDVELDRIEVINLNVTTRRRRSSQQSDRINYSGDINSDMIDYSDRITDEQITPTQQNRHPLLTTTC